MKPKTTGFEWLSHSLSAFNGLPKADRRSGQYLLSSYVDYKKSKDDMHAVDLVSKNYEKILVVATKLASRKIKARKQVKQKTNTLPTNQLTMGEEQQIILGFIDRNKGNQALIDWASWQMFGHSSRYNKRN